jgi:hypothetical protein
MACDSLSADFCLTLNCPSSLLSLVDGSFYYRFHCYITMDNHKQKKIANFKHTTNFGLSRNGLTAAIAAELKAAYADSRHVAKRIAVAANIVLRTAESYLNAERAPPSPTLLDLMADNDALCARVLYLVEARRKSKRTAMRTNNKGNNTKWSDDAVLRVRYRAEAHLGYGEMWIRDGLARRPTVYLVDSWTSV